MGILGNIIPAIKVFFGTLMIGGYQNQLKHNIVQEGVSSLRSIQLMTKIVTTAWGMDTVSTYYESLDFTQKDLEIMYTAAVTAGSNILFNNRDLFATFFLLYNYAEFGHKLHKISQSVKNKAGKEREKELINQINKQVQECLEAINTN